MNNVGREETYYKKEVRVLNEESVSTEKRGFITETSPAAHPSAHFPKTELRHLLRNFHAYSYKQVTNPNPKKILKIK